MQRVLDGSRQYAIMQGDCIEIMRQLPDRSIQCCVTSPPYFGLRDYGVSGQLGLEHLHDCLAWARGEEPCGECYVCRMRTVFAELRRTLRDDGTLWLNLGDCYNAAGRQGHGTRTGYKQGTNRASATGQDSYRATAPTLAGKNLIGIPWRVALALQADGWYLRSDIIWNKPNPMPESVTDRPTRSHEYMFLLSKSSSYYYDADAIREPHTAIPQRRLTPRSEHPKGDSGRQAHTSPAYPQSLQNEPGVNGNPLGRNKRDVWDIAPEPYPEAHFAVFPPALVQPCILAGSRTEDLVFDPFAGSGTTLAVARSLGRRAIGSELNPKYIALAERRLSAVTPALPLAQPRNLTSKAEQESDQLVMRTLDD